MKVLKDKCGKWYFVSELILLPWTHWEVLVLLGKSPVSLSRKWYIGYEVAVTEVSGCQSLKWVAVGCKGTSPSSLGRRDISHLLGTEGRPSKTQRADHERAFHANGASQRHWGPRAVARLSSVTISNWSLLLLSQHPRFRGSSGNALRDVSGFNKWEFPPCHPSYGGSSVEPGRMTDAVAYQGQEWQLAPLSHIQRRIPQHCTAPGFSPKFLSFTHTKRCPCAGAIILGKADYFKRLCRFHYWKMSFI